MQVQTFVGRGSELETLNSAWRNTTAGAPHVVVLEGPEGSGRRALVTQMLSSVEGLPLPIRIAFTEGEDGLKILLRLYASLYSSLHANAALKEAVAARIDALLPDTTEPRHQWMMAFREGMDKEAPDLSSAQFQVTIPRQSPYLALQEILATLAPEHPIVLELADVDHVLSFTFWSFITALLDRVRFQKLPILVVLTGTALSAADLEAIPFSPRTSILENLPEDLPLDRIALEPLTRDEVKALLDGHYASNRFPEGLADRLHDLSQGLPGRVADLMELLENRDLIARADDDSWLLDAELSELEWEGIAPELPGENVVQARQILQVAALEGRVFTASVISEQLELDKDTIVDLLDDLEDMVEEVIFHEGVQSWLYRFKSPLVRARYADDLSASARAELARGLAELLERNYLPRSVEYAIKAARLQKEAGEGRRSMSLIGLASSAERPDILQMGAELIKAFPQTSFPVPVYKGLHLTLFEKLAQSGPVEPLLALIDDVEAWADARKDDDIAPWLAFYRGRLLQRSGNFKDASKWAEKAQKGFAKVNNPVKEADAFNVLAMIALGRGELGIANEHVSRALKKTEFPPIKAQSLFIKGLVHKGRGELQPALDALKVALDLSGRTGQLPMHLDTGLNIAEILLMGGKSDEALGLLNQLLEIARQTKQPGRERGALSLLSKAEAGQKNFQKAIEYAGASLKLSREMKVRQLEAADLLDLGIFSFVQGQLDEGAVYLRECEKIAREIQDPRLIKEVLFHTGMVASGQKDFPRALKAYSDALKFTRELKDERREANILFNMGGIYLDQGEFARARTYLDEAAPLIEKGGNADEKKLLKKAQEQLQLKIH